MNDLSKVGAEIQHDFLQHPCKVKNDYIHITVSTEMHIMNAHSKANSINTYDGTNCRLKSSAVHAPSIVCIVPLQHIMHGIQKYIVLLLL